MQIIRDATGAFFAVALLLAAVPALAAQTQNEFRFTTYGMVCNQCAYGVEQSLQHTKGVKDAIVDLKSGSVRVIPEGSTPPSVDVLAQRIKDQRVSISKLEATLTGRVLRESEGWILEAGSQRYPLEASEGSKLDAYEGQTVTVEGVFKGVPGVDGAQGSTRLVPRTLSTS